MLKKALSALLLCGALFSGQYAAHAGAHEFFNVKNPDSQLRHEADSDEIRAAAQESADTLREHHGWFSSRKPGRHAQ
ncbi:DUF2554 family protein [Franconibacter daqui]|jgi:hypothetical protein|uniref:DUF2554 family protein n=1 Tax=Franconibacter daqui TaxID=2047724 RepID=A0ABV1PMH2_9ENTR|nr:DUF2554 family protein [Franconibacter daqui]GGD18041.1 hypothetical protein GCM10011513_14350 [Franconibacter daqui]